MHNLYPKTSLLRNATPNNRCTVKATGLNAQTDLKHAKRNVNTRHPNSRSSPRLRRDPGVSRLSLAGIQACFIRRSLRTDPELRMPGSGTLRSKWNTASRTNGLIKSNCSPFTSDALFLSAVLPRRTRCYGGLCVCMLCVVGFHRGGCFEAVAC